MSKITMPDMRNVWGRLRFSAVEWVALVTTLIFASGITYYYLDSTQPLRSKLSELRTKEKTLQNKIKETTEKQHVLDEQLANRDKILTSLESFEDRLHNRKTGITAVINEVNQIAKANHVKVGDVSFRTDAPEVLPEAKPGASPGTTPTPPPITRRDKLPVVYEGLGIDTTVEGDYADLRRFIAALERSRNFVIVNAVTLQSIDEKQRSKFRVSTLGPGAQSPGAQMNPGAGPGQPGNAPGLDMAPGGPGQIVVSLKIEMETHFSREGEAKLTPANAPAQR